MAGEIRIQGLAEFRRDLKAAADASVKDLTKAMRAAGAPVLAAAQSYAPKDSGALASSGAIRAAGTKGRVVFKAPYAAGAEFGNRGRWQGFGKWGQPPRYGYRALSEKADDVVTILERELAEIVSGNGWFH